MMNNYLYKNKNFCLLFIVFAITFIRIGTLLFSPLNLNFDEAQYWFWSTTPDWGYFSKPPFVAWAISLFSFLLGSDAEWAVRLPSAIAYGAAAFAIYKTSLKLFNDEKIALWSAGSFLIMPGVVFSSILISTDPFLLMFWAFALYFFTGALQNNSWQNWIMMGICIGLGLLAKYSMVVFIFCMMLFLIWRRPKISVLKCFCSLLTAFIIYAPNLIWNYKNGFVSYLHTKDNANLALQSSFFHIDKFLEFFGAQFAVFGPIFFMFLIIIAFRFKYIKEHPLLVSFTFPLLIIMCIQSIISRANANWAAPSYVAGVILVSAFIAQIRQIKWLKASFSLHLFAAIILYVGIISLNFINFNKTPKFLDRYLGWDNFAKQTLSLMQKYKAKVILDERKTMAYLIYYARPFAFDNNVIKWHPFDFAADYYDMKTSLKPYLNKQQDFIFISRYNQFEGYQSLSFEKFEEIKDFNFSKDDFKVYLVHNFIGYK